MNTTTSESSNVLLEIRHLGKSFGTTEVLKDISMEVRAGEVVSIIGPSGSGKSTVLRCATMLETMDHGDLLYHGEAAAQERDGASRYADAATLKRLRRSFGLVFQNFNLFPHYSVLKNITEPQRLAGKTKEAAGEKALELLEKLGLSDKADSYPCQLSGGQQQRVSIARALAMEPDILFFDEPTSALDPELTGEVLKVIRQLAEVHMTMIIVTHEMEFARQLSDRILFMENGVIRAQGRPEELFSTTDERVQAFIGKFGS